MVDLPNPDGVSDAYSGEGCAQWSEGPAQLPRAGRRGGRPHGDNAPPVRKGGVTLSSTACSARLGSAVGVRP
eukprot:scaffold2157_cov376-Prasinococcus_capsulatus_cf.AAC.1